MRNYHKVTLNLSISKRGSYIMDIMKSMTGQDLVYREEAVGNKGLFKIGFSSPNPTKSVIVLAVNKRNIKPDFVYGKLTIETYNWGDQLRYGTAYEYEAFVKNVNKIADDLESRLKKRL